MITWHPILLFRETQAINHMKTKESLKSQINQRSFLEGGKIMRSLLSNCPNLLDRDLECNHQVEIQGFHAGCYEQILNKILVFRLIDQIYPNLSHLFQNIFVTLYLVKALYPREYYSRVETLQPYEVIPCAKSLKHFRTRTSGIILS